jgi:hypothetical protein
LSDKKPIKLVNPEKPDEVIAYACGKCRLVVAGIGKGPGMFFKEADAIAFAKRHCGPWICEKCGAEHDRKNQPTCRKCFDEAWAERCAKKEAERFEKAEKVTEYDGPVFCEVAGSGDGFFHSVQDLIDHCECEDIDVPSYAWTCTVIHPQLDIDDACDRVLDEHHESCSFIGMDELRAFVEEWNKLQSDETWEPDYSRAVLIGDAWKPGSLTTVTW